MKLPIHILYHIASGLSAKKWFQMCILKPFDYIRQQPKDGVNKQDFPSITAFIDCRICKQPIQTAVDGS